MGRAKRMDAEENETPKPTLRGGRSEWGTQEGTTPGEDSAERKQPKVRTTQVKA
jgi:hypothetical protein